MIKPDGHSKTFVKTLAAHTYEKRDKIKLRPLEMNKHSDIPCMYNESNYMYLRLHWFLTEQLPFER